MMRTRVCSFLMLTGMAASIHAHPGHDILAHGPAHFLLSGYHLLVLGGSGLALAIAGRLFSRHPRVRILAVGSGVTLLIAAAVLSNLPS